MTSETNIFPNGSSLSLVRWWGLHLWFRRSKDFENFGPAWRWNWINNKYYVLAHTYNHPIINLKFSGDYLKHLRQVLFFNLDLCFVWQPYWHLWWRRLKEIETLIPQKSKCQSITVLNCQCKHLLLSQNKFEVYWPLL